MSGRPPLDPQKRFVDRAEDYARFRPSYPPPIIAAILAGYDRPLVADIGAGTGISSHLLAEMGARVVAVEPNAAMRAAIAPSPYIDAIDGSAEATGLRQGSIDIVVAFQAYHWFAVDSTLPEWKRIVAPHGRFASIWNRRNLQDPFTVAYERCLAAFGDRVTEIDRLRRDTTVAADFARAGCERVEVTEVTHRQQLDWEGLLGFVRSCSYLPRQGPEYDAVAATLRDLVAQPEFRRGFAFDWICTAYVGSFGP